MRNNFDTIRACIAIGMAVAMLFSTTVIFTGEATAETIAEDEQIIEEMPPIPPFTIYGIIYGETGEPASDATVTITNLRTGESLKAEVYENGAYEGILEDLPSGYDVGDEIEILVAANSQTITKILTVEQIGFGERVDIYFGDGKKDAESERSSTISNILNNGVETNSMSNAPLSLNSEPVGMKENSEPIIIDPQITPSNNEPIAEITLVDMQAPPYFRLAFTDKENDLRFSLRNDGDEREIVIVDLYHVEPDGITESFLKTVHFGTLLPGKEKFRNVFEDEEGWIPTETGRNWIRGEIYIQEKQNRIFVDEFKESFNVVPGWRPVLELGPTTISEPTVWENLTVVINGDLTVNAPLDIVNSDVIGDDLTVTDIYSIDPGSAHDMAASSDGQYRVEVKPAGTFEIFGKLWNNPDNAHYWFYMNGSLNLDGIYGGWNGTIENTHGSPDLSQPGGIICTTDNVLIENGATIKNGKTHGIWLENSDAVIKDSFVHDNGGNGIVCKAGSDAQIERNTIEWNNNSGIKVENAAPSIRDNTAIQWNGGHGIEMKDILASQVVIDNNQIEKNMGSGIFCNNTKASISNNTITSNGNGLKFRDDFESDMGWVNTSMWHRVTNESGLAPALNISHSGDWSWWYGNDTTANYDNGTSHSGSLESPVIDLRDATSVSLIFWSWYETDTTGTATDHRNVTVLNQSMAPKTYQLSGDTMGEWTRYIFDITEFIGRNITLTFSFDTNGTSGNNFQGWYIDDVEVIGAFPIVEGHGIYIEGNEPINIRDNTIDENNWHGVYCQDNSQATIEYNIISANLQNGIRMLRSNNNTVFNNSIKGRLFYDSVVESFENDFGEWKTDNASMHMTATDVWSIERSQDVAYDGSTSLKMTIVQHGDNDKMWVERNFTIENYSGSLSVYVSFNAYSSIVDSDGIPQVGAYIGTSNPGYDYDTSYACGGEIGWKPYSYNEVIGPSTESSRKVWIAVGLKAWWNNVGTRYIDNIQVSIYGTSSNGINILTSEDTKMENNTVTDMHSDAIFQQYSDRSLISNNTILASAESGILLKESSNNQILNNNLSNNADHGLIITSEYAGGGAIYSNDHSSYNTVENNTLNWNYASIECSGLFNTFRNNWINHTISSNWDGIAIRGARDSPGNELDQYIDISNNYFFDTGTAISVTDGNSINITNNEIYDVRSSGINNEYRSDYIRISNNTIRGINVYSHGIRLKEARYTTVDNNTISDVENGILLTKKGSSVYVTHHSIIKNNKISNSTFGIRQEISISTQVINNTFTNNDVGIRIQGATADWPSFRNTDNKGETWTYYPDIYGAEGHELFWTFDTSSSIKSSPVMYDHIIYIVSDDGTAYALDENSGILLWSYSTGESIPSTIPIIGETYLRSSASVAYDKVFFGAGDKIFALDKNTGQHLWNYTTGGYVISSPVVGANNVYVGSTDGVLYAINETTGIEEWNATTGGPIVSTPSITPDSKVVVRGWNSAVYAFYLVSGSESWNYTPDEPGGWSTPMYYSGKVIFGTYINSTTGNASMYGLNTGNGAVEWKTDEFDSNIISSPAYFSTMEDMFIASYNGTLYRVEPGTGAISATFDTTDNMISSLASAMGKVLYATLGGEIHTRYYSFGMEYWNYTGMGTLQSSPIIVDGKVFIGSNDGKLYAFYLPDDETTIKGNTISNGTTGITGYNAMITIENNGISNMTDSGIDLIEGVYSYNGSGEIRNNTITESMYGIKFNERSSPNIINNTIGEKLLNIQNETVFGPAVGGESGPFYLDNGYVINCTLYLQNGAWTDRWIEDQDYTLDYATGEINTTLWGELDPGDVIIAYYNSTTTGLANEYGILSYDSTPLILDNIIIGNDEDGITINQLGTNPVVNIEGNKIWGNTDGIIAENSFVNISHNSIAENRGRGVVLENSSGDIYDNDIIANVEPYGGGPPTGLETGIIVSNSFDINIRDNNISHNHVNLKMVNSNNVIIENNVIVDAVYVPLIYPNIPPIRGIMSLASQFEARNNTIFGTSTGFYVEDADIQTVISDNEFYRFEENPTTYGIYLVNASILIELNTMDNISTGIKCTEMSNADINNNSITNNDYGIICDSQSSPMIRYNNISGNAGFGIENYDSAITVDAQFNWWGDATGPSGYGPGTGDAVSDYIIFDPWLLAPP